MKIDYKDTKEYKDAYQKAWLALEYRDPDDWKKRWGSRISNVLFVLALFIASLFYWYVASAAQVYLEDEKDLRNGYKLCIYSEGVTITVPSYKLCPISIDTDE
jgi:hypothetical protein